jgi:hypothetical protein
MRRPRSLLWLSLIVIGLSIALGIVGPRALDWLPDGFKRPVLALELVETPADFAAMRNQTAVDPPGKPAAQLYLYNTVIDFAFIACYAALWTSILAGDKRRWVSYAGIDRKSVV